MCPSWGTKSRIMLIRLFIYYFSGSFNLHSLLKTNQNITMRKMFIHDRCIITLATSPHDITSSFYRFSQRPYGNQEPTIKRFFIKTLYVYLPSLRHLILNITFLLLLVRRSYRIFATFVFQSHINGSQWRLSVTGMFNNHGVLYALCCISSRTHPLGACFAG